MASFVRGNLLLGLLMICVSSAYADGMPESEQSSIRSGSARKTLVVPPKSDTPPVAKVGQGGANTNPLLDFELAKYQYCGNDTDCVIAINGCCDCVNGGIEVAVNKSRLEAFRSRFDCVHVVCGLEPADPVCGSGVVSCVSHRCQYLDDRKKEEF
jgi:hypothetical protein